MSRSRSPPEPPVGGGALNIPPVGSDAQPEAEQRG